MSCTHLLELGNLILIGGIVLFDVLTHCVERLGVSLAHFLDLLLVLESILDELSELDNDSDVESWHRLTQTLNLGQLLVDFLELCSYHGRDSISI